MKTVEVDVAIIGVGTAGMTAYRAAREHTDRVVTIESTAYGTTCARVGCMPSKLLIAAAEAAHAARHASLFGVHTAAVSVDGEAVMARVRAERDRFVGFTVETVEAYPDAHKLWGQARFVGPNELRVDDHTRVIAQRVVIATGSSPTYPGAWKRELGDRLITNDELFDWERLPESVFVAGAGVIGLELAQALARLGVRTKIVSKSERLAVLTDPEVSAAARAVLGQELDLCLGAQITHVARDAGGVRVHYELDGEAHEARAEYFLAATGRAPNLKALGLAALGVSLAPGQDLPVDDRTGQLGSHPIFVAGDVSNLHPLLHEAADDGRIAGDNAGRFPQVRERPRRAPLSIVFTDPQIAVAGSSYRELCEQKLSFEVGQVDFGDQGRSRVMGKNRGLLRAYGERTTGRFLGAEMIGPACEHLAHLLAWSVQHNLSVQAMLDSPFYHPVIEEGLRSALRGLRHALKMGPPPIERCIDCGPGA